MNVHKSLLLGALGFFLLGSSEAASFGNDNLQITRDNPNLGAAATFLCELPAGQTVSACEIGTPTGATWTVVGDQVLDGSNPVSGYTGLGMSDAATEGCGISIASVTAADLGDWRCTLTRSGGASPAVYGVLNFRDDGSSTPSDVRLPVGDVVPSHYDLQLVTVWDPTWTIDGAFAMTADVAANVNLITLHINDLSIIEEEIRVVNSGSDLVITQHGYDFERDFYFISFDAPAGVAFEVNVSGKYVASLKRRVLGFNHDLYTDENQNKIPLAVTQFEPNGARRAFPCMDEPNRKATYTVSLGHLSSLTALSNMPATNTGDPVTGYPGYVWTEFDISVVMSSYLVAFAISDYKMQESAPNPNGYIHKAWSRPDSIDDGYADYVVDVQPKIIAAYENMFGVDFPLPEMDQFSVPTKGGAMENWGLITYREDELLVKPDVCAAAAWQSYLYFQTHENGHQWFGDIVTTDWWTYIWLNEGFATYVSYYGAEAVEPQMENMNYFAWDTLSNALRVDSLPSSHEISQPVNTPGEANFGPITYRKGGSIIRMADAFLTNPTWTSGLTNYLIDNSYSNTVPDILFAAWNAAGLNDGTLEPAFDVKTIMDTWTLQKNFPLLTVTRDYVAGTASLTQERFISLEDNTGDTHDYSWWIPITFSSVNDGLSNFEDTWNHNTWFPADQETLVVTTGSQDSALVFNVQFYGYYRVNYDTENWNRIAAELVADHTNIHLLNRAQILFDAHELAKVDILPDYSIPLAIAQYLPNENAFIPLAFANDILFDLERSIALSASGQALYDSIFATFEGKYHAIGMDERPGNNFMDNLVQRMVIDSMCRSDQTDCVNDATYRFGQWMATPNPDDLSTNPINRHVRASVYCAAVHNGGAAEVSFLTERRTNTRDPQEEDNITGALACVGTEQQLEAFLYIFAAQPGSFSPKTLVYNLSRNKAAPGAIRRLLARDITLDKVMQTVLSNVLSHGHTMLEVKLLKQLSERYPESYEVSLDLDMARANVHWDQ